MDLEISDQKDNGFYGIGSSLKSTVEKIIKNSAYYIAKGEKQPHLNQNDTNSYPSFPDDNW